MRILKAGLLLIICAYTGFGADFGVVLSAAPEYNSDGDTPFTLTGALSPWVSALFSPTLSLYVSAAAQLEYTDDGINPVVVELDRTELNWRPVPSTFFQLGRQQFMDGVGLVAAGLFDGLQGSLSLGRARLSLGAFYTGFLYKDRAKIFITNHDSELYNRELDYGDLKTYFASRRVFIPITAEFPDFTPRSSLGLNLAAQFDVNDEDENFLHSQYLEFYYRTDPVEFLHLSFAAVTEFVEDTDLRMGFSALAGADWELPTALQDLLALQLRWSSGRMNDTIGPYLPVNRIAVGEIFSPGLTGLMYLKAAYTARLHKTLSAEAGTGYFVRTDVETLGDKDLDPDSDSRFLGGELFGSLAWAPQSALRLTAGGGVFFPEWGGAFVSGAGLRWKASMGVMVSF
ncbi:hypothetical protein [Treponema primitia]|uniref:hypothetical protein n=1 Tax=Treponema primitia TaxID=88058 RepID=UPI0002554D8B|nr:hypothetical protein [Treponema primitia]